MACLMTKLARTLLILACTMEVLGCGSRVPQPALLPASVDSREVITIDAGELGGDVVQVPELQGLMMSADQKLRITGSYAPPDFPNDFPPAAYFYSTATGTAGSVAQSANVTELTKDGDEGDFVPGDTFKFVIEIGSPTSDGGSFRVEVRGGNRVLATGRVNITPVMPTSSKPLVH